MKPFTVPSPHCSCRGKGVSDTLSTSLLYGMFRQQSKQALASPALAPTGDALSQTWFRDTSVLGGPQPNPHVPQEPGSLATTPAAAQGGEVAARCQQLSEIEGQGTQEKPQRAQKCLCSWETGFSFSVMLGKVKARPCKGRREDCLRKQSIILNNLLVIQPSQKNVPE